MLMRGLNNALETMKSSSYNIVPIHEHTDLFEECCRIINDEWPASKTRRMKSFAESCDVFPTCLVLLNRDKVVGHCKLSLIPSEHEGCFLGSVVIDHPWRSQGQEGFYLKNGYSVCPPVNIWSICIPAVSTTLKTTFFTRSDRKEYSGPPAPPMPTPTTTNTSPPISTKIYMVKRL